MNVGMDTHSEEFTTIEIQLNKQFYFPKQEVTGNIVIRTKRPVQIDSLILEIRKEQLFKISYSSQEDLRSVEPNPNSCCKHSFDIIREQAISSGEHLFPFRFILHPREESTTRLRGVFGQFYCILETKKIITAECRTEKGTLKRETMLTVFNKSDESQTSDIRIRLASPICFLSKSYWYRISTNKSVYMAGEFIHVSCFPVSLANSTIFTRARVTLVEQITAELNGRKILRSRPIAEVKALETKSNHFEARIRIPVGASATLTEGNIRIRMVLDVILSNKRGTSTKIKKYVDVGRLPIRIPEVMEASDFEAKTYPENILTL